MTTMYERTRRALDAEQRAATAEQVSEHWRELSEHRRTIIEKLSAQIVALGAEPALEFRELFVPDAYGSAIAGRLAVRRERVSA